jgi:hypothetical protein
MSRKTRRLALTATAPIVVLAVTWNLLPSEHEPSRSFPTQTVSRPSQATTPSNETESAPDSVEFGSRSYAVPLPELHGLPPDAAPGTELELWVAWEPPITSGPKFQRLVPHLTLQRIAPPVEAGAPPTVLLAVPTSRLSDLLYGDRFGTLSVAVRPPRDRGNQD